MPVVRTWNVYHGNSFPPGRRSYLSHMVGLASADRPTVLCLQELPTWATSRLEGWSSMRAFPVTARHALLPGPWPGWITRLHQGWIRSALAGQANAILVSPDLEAEDLGSRRISTVGRERRIVHAVRIKGLVVANLHASHARHARESVEEEIERAREFAEGLASHGEGVVLAGDFNLPGIELPGYSSPTSGIDQVLVRGAPSGPPLTWPPERRTLGRVLLSDHAPVEVTVG